MELHTNRRQFMLGAGALLAGATVAGCRSSTSVGTSKASPGPSLVAPTGKAGPELTPSPRPEDIVGGPDWNPPDLSGTTIKLWGLNYAPHVERYQLLGKRFEELTGAKVDIQPQDDPQKQMLTALTGGNPPDVICLMGRMSDQIVKQDGLLDLTSAVYGDLKIDNSQWWFTEAIDAYTWDGKILGVPLESNGQAAVGCRLDLIEAAGSKVDGLWPGDEPESAWPAKGAHFESFDQMFQLAEILTRKKGSKVKVWGQNRQGWEMNQIASYMHQLGVLWWDEAAGTFDFDNDACVQALDWMVTKPYQLGIEALLAAGNSVNAFVGGQCALGIGNNASAGEGAKAGFKTTNVVQPSIVPGEVPKLIGEGGWGFEVPVGAKNQEGGVEFARFATTYEAQFIYSQIYGGNGAPSCRPIIQSEIYAGDSPHKIGLRRLHTALPNTQFQGHGFDPQIVGMIGEIVNTLREGKMDTKATAAELQQQVTAQQARFAR
jgi:ABC-type glycerol-3-phosphate transport system substrate-binding protein